MASVPEYDAGSPEYAKDPEKYHLKCLSVVQDAIEKNPFINILINSMKEHGCEVTPDFFKCKPCPIKVGGFYDETLGIVMCENQQQLKTTLEDTLVHELVHAFDSCRADIDPDDCLQIACTEIRAANLSGECGWSRELMRGQYKFQKHLPECVKRRGIATLQMNTKCAKRAPEYIEAAWRSCYRDTAPFGFVPL
jgi:inner membrane protease ATP23